MADTPQQPSSKRVKTDDGTASPASQQMSQAIFHPYHANQHYTAYGGHHGAYNYQQGGYVPQHMSLAQGGQPLSAQYQQSMQSTMPSYHHINPMSSNIPRKRGASDMEAPSLATNLGMTPAMTYPMATGGLMATAPMSLAGPGSGLGISTMQSQGLDAGPESATQIPDTPAPAVKKGRTNTPWTPAEEQRLKAMRDTGNSWSEIAKAFPNRTEGSVKKHWYKDMHYAEFGDDEGSFKQALIAAIKEYEQNKWKSIGQKVGKPAKACEAYAREHLNKA